MKFIKLGLLLQLPGQPLKLLIGHGYSPIHRLAKSKTLVQSTEKRDRRSRTNKTGSSPCAHQACDLQQNGEYLPPAIAIILPILGDYHPLSLIGLGIEFDSEVTSAACNPLYAIEASSQPELYQYQVAGI